MPALGPKFKKTCQHCGEIFTVTPCEASRKFCSKQCADAFKTSRPFLQLTKPKIEKTCEHCGKSFWVHPYRSDIAHFCSRSCSASHAKGPDARNWKGGNIELVCGNCGKPYQVNPSRAPESHYCSDHCKMRGINKGKRSYRWRGGPQEKTCIFCGEKFTTPSTNPKQRFCSCECHNKYRMKRVRLICPTCGKEFEKRQSRLRYENTFCSFTCYRSHRPTSIELAIQNKLREQSIEFIPEYAVGVWTVDIYIPVANLAIECDGDYWHKNRKCKDAYKDAQIAKQGIQTLRLSEHDIVERPDYCLQLILSKL